jgi:hypothetical protein
MPMRAMGDVPPELVRKWMHSFEEDAGDVQVYRPEGYAFPRARGRAGIEFQPGDSMTLWRIGRGDAREAVRGRWERAGASQIRVSFPSAAGAGREEAPPFTLEIVECTDEILRVKRR